MGARIGGQAEPAHAGVDFDMHRIGPRARWNQFGELFSHEAIVDDRGESMLSDCFDVLRLECAKNEN